MRALLVRYLRLTPADRRLLLEAGVAVSLVRLGLTLLSLRWVQRMGSRVPVGIGARGEGAIGRTAWSVAVTSRVVPGATCLTQALACQMLLRRRGYDSEVRLGVARGSDGELEAHAWLECGGRILVGGESVADMTPFPPFERGFR